ncbi:MAG: OsmC family protein [Saprospiraceae bacterium]|nr:OsmC family protein [Saprospiraceae bacterium]
MVNATLTARNTPNGYQTILSNGTLGYLADEPVADEGTGLGFSPIDLLLGSLAACKTMTVRYLARQKGWEIGEVHAELYLETERISGQSHTKIKSKMRIEGNLSADQLAQLYRAADRCPVHRILTGEMSIEEVVSF